MTSVGSSEDSRTLLQDRLAVFGKWMFLMTVVFGVSVAVAEWLLVDVDRPDATVGQLHDFLLYFLPLPLWIAMRRGRWSLGALRGVDAAVMAAYGAGFGLLCTQARELELPVAVAVLAAGIVATARAIVVPSTWWRTLWISALTVAPAAMAAGWIGSNDPDSSEYQRQMAYIDGACWGALGITVATVASRIIFGLRREAGRMKRLGQYQIDEKIGEGGMGAVYKASHSMLRRPTAIKLLHNASEQNLQRFAREVRLTAQLTHPNTVAVYDYGRTADGVFYYAMELLDGIDLEQLVKHEGRVAAGRVIHILRQVVAALGEAHGIGLIHRDIKPANIILCERGGRPDVAKVVDFGLVKNLEGSDGSPAMSTDNQVVGTPLYLSPEAIGRPSTVDGRSDLYAVGAVGYFLLTGQPVFDGTSIMEVCGHHLHSEPRRPSSRIATQLPADLEDVLLRCLGKDPCERYATASDLVDALDGCADSQSWTVEQAGQWWKAFRASAGAHRERLGVPVGARDTLAVSLADRGSAPE